jgi:hypothetical protein
MSAEFTGEAVFRFPKDTCGTVVEFSAHAAGQSLPSSDLELCGMRFRAKGFVRSVMVDEYDKNDTLISLMTSSRVRLEGEPSSEAFGRAWDIVQSLVHVKEK